MRSPFAPVALPIAALIAALARWQLQGSRNIYSAFNKRFYVPDPDLGTRVSPEHPIWLGLEICAIIAAIAVGLVVGGWIIRRREAKRGDRASLLRAASWIVAAVPLVIPIAAFASGSRPAGAIDTLPSVAGHAAGTAAGISGAIDAPAGRYEVIEHAGSSITASLSAGGDKFDARFAGGIRGAWTGDPHDLSKSANPANPANPASPASPANPANPVIAEISVDAAGVDTGIGERSKHAREEYLLAEKFPRITITIDRLLAASPAGTNAIAFRAHAILGFIGKTHSIEISGTLRKPDAGVVARFGLSGEILLVQADFAIAIKETALASDAKDFDGDKIPIHVSLVLRRASS